MSDEPVPAVDTYGQFLNDLKERIRTAQVKAALSVNRELILLYWHIGTKIPCGQQSQGWGAKVINRIAVDLKKAFPHFKGFSRRNLQYMRAFAQTWPGEQSVQQLVTQIPWGHNVRILDFVKDPAEQEWYIKQTVQYGWSRDILVHQIERRMPIRNKFKCSRLWHCRKQQTDV